MTERTRKSLIKMKGHSTRAKEYTREMTFDDFICDEKTMDAVVFNLSQIGELVSFIEEGIQIWYPEVEWRNIKGLRNRIIHDYEGIKPKMLWSVIKFDLDILIKNIDKILVENK